MKFLNIIALILCILGALNWLLFAFGFNLITAILQNEMGIKAVYIVIGLSGAWVLANIGKLIK